jgi:hypothetical protein
MWRAFERAGYAVTNKILPAKVKAKPRKRTAIPTKRRKPK